LAKVHRRAPYNFDHQEVLNVPVWSNDTKVWYGMLAILSVTTLKGT